MEIRLKLCASGIALAIAGLAGGPAAAQGQDRQGPASAGPQLSQADIRPFAIPAQPLATALLRFSRETGIELFFDDTVAQGVVSPGANGRFTPEGALRRLLAGTGLAYRFTNGNTVTVSRPGRADDSAIRLDPLTVEGQGEVARGPAGGYVASRSATGTKTDTPIIETPQAISVVTRDQMTEQGAQSVSESLRYTPGVFVEPNGATSRYDETRIRGFTPVQYLDGMQVPLVQFFATPRIEAYGLERVEALKGPSSALYGESSPGGLLNMVSKRPTAYDLREVQVQAGSFERLQGGVDIGGPLDAGGQFLYRLTGLVRDAETVVDFTEDDRRFIAPAFTWRPAGGDTTVTLLAQYAEDDGNYPQQYLPAEGTLLSNPNGRIPETRFAGEPGFDVFERDQFHVGYELEHRFDETWTVRQNLRYGEVDTFFRAFRSEGLQADLRTLNRSAFSQQVSADTFTVDNQAQADFATGALQHKILGGVDYLYATGDFGMDFAFGGSPTLDIFNPSYGAAFPALSPRSLTHQVRDQVGVYFQDQVKLGNWSLTGGARYDWATARTEDRLASTTTEQSDEALTGRVGLTYLFDSGIAPYASFATSFQPQSGTDSAGNPFDPTEGTQYEIGVKYQPEGSESLVTLSVFDLTQENALTPDPADPVNFSVQTGEIEVRGIELEVRAKLTDSIDLIGSYAFLDSEVTRSNNTDELGRRVPLTPQKQGSIWLNYSFAAGPLNGLQLGGGVRYVGETYSETGSANPVQVPSYTLVDAAIHYDLGKLSSDLEGARFSINATNLFDNYHVTYCFEKAYCSLGASRTVFGTLSYRW